ncbi:replication protein [Photobacterium aquae]|uniref:Replication protein n=1 Tax=Photobacterium aquae TaxID=1195763 RepID=A0A0J1GV96_9GAMM|nr:replication initiation protein [Photobacterium aquae]KLV03650.1 replication protein [Photobacterium aquae]
MTDNRNKRFQISTENSQELPNQFFKKSHELVFSQLGLSAREHDMMALFLSRLNREHWEDFLAKRDIHAPQYTFHSDVLKEWFGLSSKQLYPTLRPVAERLASRKVGLSNDDAQEFDFIPLFARVKYSKGALTIVPNSELIHAYVDYSAGHAQINHHAFRSLKSEHSKRLYTLLSRFKDSGTQLHPQRIESLHALYGLLDEKGNLLKKSYSQNKVFIDRCLKKPIEEMSQCADVSKELEFLIDEKSGNLGFAPVMQGRRIIAVEFLYRWKQPVNQAEKQARAALAQETVPENPMLQLVREAYNIVMMYPLEGRLNEKHLLALQSVELGIITLPEDIVFDEIFRQNLDKAWG